MYYKPMQRLFLIDLHKDRPNPLFYRCKFLASLFSRHKILKPLFLRQKKSAYQGYWRLPSPPIVEKNMCIFYVVVVAVDMSENDAEDMSENDAEDMSENADDDDDADDDDVDDVDDVDDDDVDEEEEGGGGGEGGAAQI